MKKIITSILIATFVFAASSITIHAKSNNESENLYKKLFITAITNDLLTAVDEFYIKNYNITGVSFDIDSIDVLEVKETNGKDIYPYIIKLRAMPFTGPHNIIGYDTITIKLGNLQNNVKIIDYEHKDVSINYNTI